MSDYSIIPPSAVYQEDWPVYSVLPQGLHGSLSVAGWTSGNEGFVQQTFLGASIRSFNVNAGFGDTSSTMGIELVNDEFNTSDGTYRGVGDDVYHDGAHDHFMPPVVGSPVFFKFGKNYASLEQAFRRTLDETYGENTLEMPDDPFETITKPLPVTRHEEGHYLLSKDTEAGTADWIDKSPLLDPETKWRGFSHFAFGGILQSYTENRSPAGNPLYSVKLVDPREILSNTELLFNNYQGTTFNNKNLYNVYGFLEYDPSDDLVKEFDTKSDRKEILTKNINKEGKVTFEGLDIYEFSLGGVYINSLGESSEIVGKFPITGQGFSRRSENGIPWYRVEQSLVALFDYNGKMPKEYRDAGFGGVIDFRGYNYVVDWTGIPTDQIPLTYYLDFDQINMLDLAQELCDVLSRDLFVSLLPVIDHPACKFLYNKNQAVMEKAKNAESEDDRELILGSGLVAGIIRIDTIDRKKPPTYGKVKEYLDDLESKDIFVENRDVGFEVSNVTTDKFIVGAQEVEMYYFNGLRDRDNYLERLRDAGDDDDERGMAEKRLEHLRHDKWTLPTNLNQQIIPFYGFIGDKAVTIPRGFGSWQQILLDARHLDAFGVGAYYVATEMELRAASVSFESWTKFLLNYDEVYLQEVGDNQGFWGELSSKLTEVIDGINDELGEDGDIRDHLDQLKNRKFGVSVPRCVWNSDKSPNITYEPVLDADGNEVLSDPDDLDSPPLTEKVGGGPFEGKMADEKSSNEGFPANPCNPPFGYPLYYQRAQSIGIPQAGLTDIHTSVTTILSNIAKFQDTKRSDQQRFSVKRDEARISLRSLDGHIARLEATINRSHSDYISEEGRKLGLDPFKFSGKLKTLRAHKLEIIEKLEKDKNDLETITKTTVANLATAKKQYKGMTGLIKNLARTDRQFVQNAKKVYNFVKKIADDNLGKKFLIKIPKATNVFYNRLIEEEAGRAWDVLEGPFGFEPQPISTIPDYKGGEEWKEKINEIKINSQKAEREYSTTALSPKSNIHWHYLDVPEDSLEEEEDESTVIKGSYKYGALKCNYNPMAEQWEYNYAPEPQGGFFNYALYDRNLSASEAKVKGLADKLLPPVTRGVLAPKLMNKIVTNGNRIQCYARYDHSQHLDFGNVNADSVEQQEIDGSDPIPDVMETLPNLNPDKKASLDQIQARTQDDKDLERQAESVAFVKCEINENFYMAPKVVTSDAAIWAEKFSVNLIPPTYDVIWVKDDREFINDPEDNTDDPAQIDNLNFGCDMSETVKHRVVPSFGVPKGGGVGDAGHFATEVPNYTPWDDFDREWSKIYKGWIIKTQPKDLDPDHVYALITVPGRIIPTVDSRYVDGPLKALNGASISNAMTEDVVKIKEFTNPVPLDAGTKEINCDDEGISDNFTFENINRAIQAQEDAVKGITLSTPNTHSKLAFMAPSPIYPNVVSLPLMSLERCYGPWLSSALDGKMLDRGEIKYSDIGGKIEFIKEEKLAPWNYAGYQLMDDAAKLKTEFANSLLLFSERGSFSYADAPIGVSLAKALRDKGPLVTSISVDISRAIKTSVKLDLYTSQFGKLNKQKEIAISQISRERQKMIDKNNLLERRGIGKNAAAKNLNMTGTLLGEGGQGILDLARESNEFFTEIEKGKVPSLNLITVSATNREEEADGSPRFVITKENHEGLFQSQLALQERSSLFTTQRQLDEATNRTAGAMVSDLFVGFSDSPNNKYFASRRLDRRAEIDKRIG